MTTSRAQRAATQGALIVPAGELGTIAISGADRKTWLNGLVTSDLSILGSGHASYGLVLQKIGRIVAAVWVVEAGERLILGTLRERIPRLVEHFDKYLIMEDAHFADASDQWTWAFLHGPRAEELAQKLTVPQGWSGALDVTGLGGAVVVGPADELVGRLQALGDDQHVVVGSPDDWEALRIARFVPRFGIDFSDKNYPQEAALEKVAVSFNKGCYLGQEVVCRLEMRGHVTKKLVPVRVLAETPPPVGSEVHSTEGRLLGIVSSATREGNESAALAMIRYDFADPGTPLQIAGAKACVLARPAWA